MLRTGLGKALLQTLKNSRQIVALAGPRYFSNDVDESNSMHWTKDELDKIVKKDKIVVFMKGTPDEPLCGFSRAVMQIFERHGVDQFPTYNVLEDERLRKIIKEYSNWPTIPQVYMNGEFVGGCDIMIQMHQSGDLVKELENIGIRSALIDETEE